MRYPKNLSLFKFGRLHPMDIIRKNKWNDSVWMCFCDCGKYVEVTRNNLTQGRTKSCGCLKSEVSSQRAKIRNTRKKMQSKTVFNFTKLNEKAGDIIKDAGNAGYDLVATSREDTEMYVEYGTGLAVEIPDGFVGLLFPRSSQSKYSMILANCVGVIDSSYRGEIKARFKKVGEGAEYNVGDRVVQLVIVPIVQPAWSEVDKLSDTNRGSQGFGSSGQ